MSKNINNEKEFFIDFINNPKKYLEINYDKEYNVKGDLNKIEKNNKIKQFDIINFDKYITENKIKDFLIDEIINIDEDILYKSEGHGISHNIKVLIYALIMCIEQKLNSDETKIVLDCCKYHDIGRKDDLDDEYHGERSANMIEKLIKNDEFYENIKMKNLLKAAMEIHSKNDKQENNIALKYQININEFKNIYYILKDADALDRIRLTIETPLITDLDINYLRTNESKQLIKFASQINLIYNVFFKKVK